MGKREPKETSEVICLRLSCESSSESRSVTVCPRPAGTKHYLLLNTGDACRDVRLVERHPHVSCLGSLKTQLAERGQCAASFPSSVRSVFVPLVPIAAQKPRETMQMGDGNYLLCLLLFLLC